MGTEPKPWGYKVVVSAYYEGEVYNSLTKEQLEALQKFFFGANFVGAKIEEVQEEPQDQGSS